MNGLYVLRHGETEWNTQKRYQGQMDSPLTEKGKQKIREQRELLKDIPFARVYCSPLGRCRQTMEILNPPAESCFFDDRLMEFGLGVLQGKTHKEVPVHQQEQQKNFWENPEDFALEGAETFSALEERVSGLLEEIQMHHGPLLLITHTVIIKMLLKILEGRPLRDLWEKPYLFPGTLIRFRRENKQFLIDTISHPQGAGAPIKAYTA